MTRTKGAADIKRRKSRSDKGHKRKFYAKKRTKPRRNVNGKYIPYVSKRKRDDDIHIGFISVTPMSRQGYLNFPSEARRKIWKYVYGKYSKFLILPPEEVSTKEKIEEVAKENLWEGTWQLRLPSNSKNKGHCSYRTFAIVKIKDSKEGLKVRVTPSFKRRSLKRLWWWRGG